MYKCACVLVLDSLDADFHIRGLVEQIIIMGLGVMACLEK
jgi:hypothetical protein